MKPDIFLKEMGSEFEKEPFILKEDLERIIRYKEGAKSTLIRLGALKILIKDCEYLIEKLQLRFKRGMYAMSDDEISYRERYCKRYMEVVGEPYS